MQAEFTYVAIFILVGVFLLLTVLRVIRAAGNTIGQLRYELKRDREQHKRIAKERNHELLALRQSSRRIDGKAVRVNWDVGGRRAHRDEEADFDSFEVFNEIPRQEMKTPWGWPSSSGGQGKFSGRLRKPDGGARIADSARAFFKPKKVVDEAHRARQAQSIRALIEDRYSRVDRFSAGSDIEWSRPELPDELIREREANRFFAKRPQQDAEFGKSTNVSRKLAESDLDSEAKTPGWQETRDGKSLLSNFPAGYGCAGCLVLPEIQEFPGKT